MLHRGWTDLKRRLACRLAGACRQARTPTCCWCPPAGRRSQARHPRCAPPQGAAAPATPALPAGACSGRRHKRFTAGVSPPRPCEASAWILPGWPLTASLHALCCDEAWAASLHPCPRALRAALPCHQPVPCACAKQGVHGRAPLPAPGCRNEGCPAAPRAYGRWCRAALQVPPAGAAALAAAAAGGCRWCLQGTGSQVGGQRGLVPGDATTSSREAASVLDGATETDTILPHATTPHAYTRMPKLPSAA